MNIGACLTLRKRAAGWFKAMKKFSSYITTSRKSIPRQLELFSKGQDEDPDMHAGELEEIISLLQKKRKWRPVNTKTMCRNIIGTFNIYPINTSHIHLERANVQSSSTEALSKDWKNVGLDIALALVKEHRKFRKSQKQHG